MTTDTQNHTQPPTTWVHPIKQLNDDREYCVFTLPNGLQVTTVSDPNTTMSACALDIGVGSFSDPVHIQGLAHFLEHMLFLGTEKYPDENSYNETLAKNGGVSNAYTTFENTNYYFSVKSETLNEMLDRFSQFFIAPLFTETATGREMNAVHSEHQKNIQSDPWRFFQMIKNAINPKHPLGRFATGNLETLRDDPAKNGTNTRAELLDFHKKFYSANIMKVCILGSESSEVLRQWASDFFGPVKNHNIERPTYGTAEILPPPTTQIDSMTTMTSKTEMNDKTSSSTKNTCKNNTNDDTKDTNEEKHTPIYRIYPVNAENQLIVHWSLAPDEEFYRSGPLSHISELMGHEGEGSILETLKEAGYATSLSSGPQVQCSGVSVFSVSIILTEKGLEKYEDVLQVIYSYLDILRHASDEEWKKQHEMKAAISEMEFQYSPRSAVYSYASDIATNLHKYAPEDVLSGGRLFKEFDLPLIREYIKHMVPQNMLVFLSSQALAKSMGFSKEELKAVQEESAAAAAQEGEDGTGADADTDVNKDEMSDKKGNVQATPVTATPTTATPNPVKGQFGPIHTDKYYGTKYTVSSLPLAYTTALLECYDTKKPATSEVGHITLHLPRLNPFIATDFTVYTSEAGDTKVPGTIKTLGATEKLELSRIPPRRIILDHQGKVITEFPASEKTNLAFLDKLNDICLDFDPLAEVEAAFETAAETAESSKTEPEPTKAGDAADKTNVATHMRDEAAELYYKLDVCYEEPKLTVVNIVYTSEAYSTIRKHVLTTLFCRMFNDALTADILYDAELAGLSVAISETALGVQIYFTGFSQKLNDFMKVIYERLHTQSYDPLRFEMNRNAIIKGYRAQFMIDTYGQCNYLASVAVNDPLYHFRDKLLEIQDITFEEFNAFWPTLFRRTRLSTLVHGNATYEQALEAARIAQKSLQKYVLSRSEIRWQRSIVPDTGLTWVKATNSNPDCAENAVSVSYYVKDCTPLKSALAQLLTQCISDKAFDKLRTNEQLGYIVANYASRARNTLTITFLIQSSRSAMYLDSRVESFIAEVGIPYVENLDDENFEQFKQSLLSQLNKPDDSIDAEARRHITAMQTVDCAFMYPLNVIKEIEGITKEQIVAFAKEYLSFSPDRRKVSTHIYGCNITVPKKFEIIQPEDESIKRVPENIHFDEKDITIVTLPTIAQFKSVSSYVPLGNLRM